jgi:hypothetical protein
MSFYGNSTETYVKFDEIYIYILFIFYLMIYYLLLFFILIELFHQKGRLPVSGGIRQSSGSV